VLSFKNALERTYMVIMRKYTVFFLSRVSIRWHAERDIPFLSA